VLRRSSYGFGLGNGGFTEFEGFVVFADGDGDGVAGMPHNFDSVELTNFKRGLLGLQKLFFSSALICWAWLILTVSICAIITVIVRATTTFITVDRVIILFIKLYIENIKYLNISCPNYYDHIYLWLFIRIFSLFSCPLIVNNPHITSYFMS
jgi:hypothetical protein